MGAQHAGTEVEERLSLKPTIQGLALKMRQAAARMDAQPRTSLAESRPACLNPSLAWPSELNRSCPVLT